MAGRKYSRTYVKKFFLKICKSTIFNFIVMSVIVINTISLSLDRHPISAKESYVLEKINFYSTWIFIIEMIIKILGLGILTYSMDHIN